MKFVFSRFLIIPLIAILLDLYAFQAVKTVTENLSANSRRTIYICFWSITFLVILLLIAGMFKSYATWPKFIRVYLTGFLMIVYVCKLIIVIFLLVDDLIRLGRWVISLITKDHEEIAPEHPQITRSLFISQAALVVAAIPFASLVYGMIYGAFDYKVRRLKLAFSNLPTAFDGLKILQFSDIHTGSFTETHHLQRAVDMINAEKADIVFFTGDFVNNKTDEIYPYVDVLKQVKAPMGVFSILGNHDYGDYYEWDTKEEKVENLAKLFQVNKTLGWDLLLNENRIITRNGQSIAIAGCENWGSFARFPKYGDLDKTTKNLENIPFTILLSHDPSHWDAQVLSHTPKLDLMLAGHTHGMQFGIDTKWFKWSPVQYFYKEWAGLYRQGSQYLYVNRGLGFLGYPGRAGIRPEITVIELKSA